VLTSVLGIANSRIPLSLALITLKCLEFLKTLKNELLPKR
jgi:hypothetical protein